jgi:hypothetical protein
LYLENNMPTVDLSRRDIGRLLVGVRERLRKLDRGLSKFGDNFDPSLGANMTEAREAYSRIETVLKEAIREENDHPRRAGRDPAQRQARH